MGSNQEYSISQGIICILKSLPGNDQLTIQFLSEQLVRKCMSGSGTSLGWSWMFDEETSPKASAYVIAAIGYSSPVILDNTEKFAP